MKNLSLKIIDKIILHDFNKYITNIYYFNSIFS